MEARSPRRPRAVSAGDLRGYGYTTIVHRALVVADRWTGTGDAAAVAVAVVAPLVGYAAAVADDGGAGGRTGPTATAAATKKKSAEKGIPRLVHSVASYGRTCLYNNNNNNNNNTRISCFNPFFNLFSTLS